MNIADLKAGTQVRLNYYLKEQKREYETAIVGVKKNIVLVEKILDPNGGGYVKFPVEMIGSLLYTQGGKLYVWSDIKVEQVILKNELYYKVTVAKEEGDYTNRRKAYRLFIGKPTQVSITTSEGKKNYPVMLKDISETGFGFISKEELENGKRAEIKFELSEGKSVVMSGHIVRKQQTSEQRQEYVYGCALGGRSDILAKYIMKQQMQGRSK